MKKLLLACDGSHFPSGALEFAVSVNRHEPILLKGVFLPSIDYSRLTSLAYANGEGFIPEDFYEEEEKTMDKSIMQFENACREHGINYGTLKYTGYESLQSLLDETRFSDMVLIGSEHFFSAMDSDQPNAEMNQLLHDSECPVCLIPEKIRKPENIVFAYDGEGPCMAAIRTFSSLMPNYTHLPLTAVFFSDSTEDKLPNEKNMKEYIKCHYKQFNIKVAAGKSVKDLDQWMSAYKNPLIITGSYSRSGLSRVFKKSFISTAIASHQFPIFLFHGKEKQ